MRRGRDGLLGRRRALSRRAVRASLSAGLFACLSRVPASLVAMALPPCIRRAVIQTLPRAYHGDCIQPPSPLGQPGFLLLSFYRTAL